MSWQDYVDTQLVSTGKVTRAAILGKQGGVWAASGGYNLSPEEQNVIIGTMFKEPGDMFAHGVKLGGVKFLTTMATPDEFRGRKGENGCCIIPTTQAIIVAEYDSPILVGDANVVVAKLADYLKSVGY